MAYEIFAIDAENEIVRKPKRPPELALWAAVFNQALADMRLSITEYDCQLAWDWVDSNCNEPGSFVWICSLFDLDVEQTRRKIYDGEIFYAPWANDA